MGENQEGFYGDHNRETLLGALKKLKTLQKIQSKPYIMEYIRKCEQELQKRKLDDSAVMVEPGKCDAALKNMKALMKEICESNHKKTVNEAEVRTRVGFQRVVVDPSLARQRAIPPRQGLMPVRQST